MDLHEKRLLVTGAASGIGLATVNTLRAMGARVFGVDRNLPAECQADLTSSEDCERAVASMLQQLGGIDGLAHCAGIQTYGTAVNTSDEVWERTLAVNVSAAFRICRAALPHLQNAGVVLVGSVQSMGAIGNSTAYVTSKHAIFGLARSIAIDFAAKNIRCNCVMPGAIDTPMLRASAALTGDAEATLTACADLSPLGRLGQPEEVAQSIAWLLSPASSFMSGAALVVDGATMTPIGGNAFGRQGTSQART
jgi:NAD(P)-dependent dehydrogenase (short-subunit alcohol dehydrogenase family)